MQKYIALGRLVRDPETRYSQGENSTAITKFTIAIDRDFKRANEPDADFFSCVTFGKTAEAAEKYLKQGTKIVIVGKVENNNYTNKEGQKVYAVQIRVEEWHFAESKGSGNGNAVTPPEPSLADANDGFANLGGIDDSEMPFR